MMPLVVGVRFRPAGKIYYFDPGDMQLEPGTTVVVETVRGMELGTVVLPLREVSDEDVAPPLKKVVRIATPEDLANQRQNESMAREALEVARGKVSERGLEMKLVAAEYTLDRSRVIIYFTADGRVDFRELVKDLASALKTRVELRQIGVRDEAKMLGGIGPCGRRLCCATFLTEFSPVSVKMAKEQNLSLNPTKISGVCGRLLCCLRFEVETLPGAEAQADQETEGLLEEESAGVEAEEDRGAGGHDPRDEGGRKDSPPPEPEEPEMSAF